MIVTRASGDRIRLTTRSGRFLYDAKSVGTGDQRWGPTLRDGFYAISHSMVPQIPYSAIGIGIAAIFGVWAFIVAETIKERALIASIPAIVFLIPVVFPSRPGRLISLVGWMFYGVGCIIYLKLNGMEIR